VLALAPEDEDTLRRLLAIRARQGDRSGALREYETFARRLAADYGLEPTEATRSLVERIRHEEGHPAPVPRHSARAEIPPAAGVEGQGPGLAPARRFRLRTLHLGLATALVVSALWIFQAWRPTEPEPVLDPDLIAVLPFRLVGGDSLSATLGEGMVDLLAIRLSGEGEPHAVDARTALAAWERAGGAGRSELPLETHLGLARHLGAGRLLTGSMVATPGRWNISAFVYDTNGGELRARAEVGGAADSLTQVVDQLLAALLSLEAGEERTRLEDLMTRSLPALQAYLHGRSAYRHGRFGEAAGAYQQALQLDSTFALAAVGLRECVVWAPAGFAPGLQQQAESLAWAHRDRLSAQDQLRFRAHAGASYPQPTPLHEHIRFVDRVLATIPDDPELWFELGDDIFHAGPMVGIEDWLERSTAAFNRAVALDSTYMIAVLHQFDAAVVAGDNAAVRTLGQRLLADDSSGVEIRWVMATLLGDDATLRELRRVRLRQLAAVGASRLELNSVRLGAGMQDVIIALDGLRERAATVRERTLLHNAERRFALNRGRPAEALRASRQLLADAATPPARAQHLRNLIYDALYWDGDTAAAAEAAVQLEGVSVDSAAMSFDDRVRNLCASELWRQSRNAASSGAEAPRQLAAAALADEQAAAHARLCAGLLETLRLANGGRIPPPRKLAALDSLLTTGIFTAITGDPLIFAGNLMSARLHARSGNAARALAAARRRAYPRDAGGSPVMLSPLLREEARLAAQVGDRAGAVRAYRHYLALRAQPEPPVAPEVLRVRTELTALLRHR
jgi:hypothetical protein